MKKGGSKIVVDSTGSSYARYYSLKLTILEGYAMKRIAAFFIVLTMFLISACATPMTMGLGKGTERIDLKDESLLLLTVELVNEYKPSYQPQATGLIIEKPDIQGKEDRLSYTADEEGTFKSDKGNRYVFRMIIKDGKYIIRGIGGFSGFIPRGRFFMPLHSEIEIKGPSVLYLGRVIGKVRERKENEFRAGSTIPALDQAITGFSGGTFDVNVIDNYEEDLKFMKTLFPALGNVQVKSAVLPPFDRAKAQKWWEDVGPGVRAR